jgi:predicted CopG family antitoxin
MPKSNENECSTTIKISKKVKENLDKLRVGGESYSSAIGRIVDVFTKK